MQWVQIRDAGKHSTVHEIAPVSPLPPSEQRIVGPKSLSKITFLLSNRSWTLDCFQEIKSVLFPFVPCFYSRIAHQYKILIIFFLTELSYLGSCLRQLEITQEIDTYLVSYQMLESFEILVFIIHFVNFSSHGISSQNSVRLLNIYLLENFSL